MALKTSHKAGAGVGAMSAVALAVSIAAPAEGYVSYVYRDPVGVLTFCYGETQNANGLQGKHFSQQECKALLERRMAHYDQGNAACVPKWESLPVEVKGAFDSFSYNLGNATFCKSTARKLLLAGDIRGACHEMGKFIKAGGRVLPGLVKRRATEQMMCLRGAS
jgi:lysozyme